MSTERKIGELWIELGRSAMGHAKPTRDEFDLSGNVVTHKPTGATWVAYEGVKTPHSLKRGFLGGMLANGDDYYPEEVAAFAHALLAERIKSGPPTE
jgi:hypothetical protein